MRVLCTSILLAGVVAKAAATPLDLSLAQSLERASNQAHAVARANAVLDEATAQVQQTRSTYLPSLSLSQDWTRTNDPVAVFGTRLQQERFRAMDFDLARLNDPDALTGARSVLQLRQPLFSSGRDRHERRAASQRQSAASASAHRTRQAVVLRTTQAYWGLVLAAQTQAVTDAALTAARRHATDTEAFRRHGSATQADRLAADLRVAELQADSIDVVARWQAAQEELTLLLGLPADSQVRTTDTLTETPEPAPMSSVPEPGSERADITAARRQLAAAVHDARATAGWLWPRVSAFGQVSANGRSPLAPDGTSWMAGAVMQWDLFSGYAARGATDAAKARARRAEVELAQLEARSTRDVRQAERALHSARQRVVVAEGAVAQAEEYRRVAQAEVDAGIRLARTRLDADTAWYEARLRSLQALHDKLIAQAQLAFAAGVSTHPQNR